MTMRQIRQLARPAVEGLSAGRSSTLGVARSTIQDNLKRGLSGGLACPLGRRTDGVLKQVCLTHAGVKRGSPARRAGLGLRRMRTQRPGVQSMCWAEYRAVQNGGVWLPSFCICSGNRAGMSPHAGRTSGGDKVLSITRQENHDVDPKPRVVREAESCVAVLGASNYHLRRGAWTQKMADDRGHVRMVRFFGGVLFFFCLRLVRPGQSDIRRPQGA